MACACVDCFFRALEAEFRYGLHPEPAAANTNKIQPADKQLEVYSATLPSSTGESAGAITGTVEYVCPGGRNAASPVSTKSKDPVSAPARAAAGGDETE